MGAKGKALKKICVSICKKPSPRVKELHKKDAGRGRHHVLDCPQLSRGKNSQLSPPGGLQLAMLMQANLAAVQIFSWGWG